jgi:hypothetical protein
MEDPADPQHILLLHPPEIEEFEELSILLPYPDNIEEFEEQHILLE